MTAQTARGQEPESAANMQLIRDKLKTNKKSVVAANMDLNDAEASAFWPIYEAYQEDLNGINMRWLAAVNTYWRAFVTNTLTDEQADSLANIVLVIDQDEVTLLKTYAAKLQNGVLPGKKLFRFIQMELKFRAALRYEMAVDIPLVT